MLVEKRSFRHASCWSELVVNGGGRSLPDLPGPDPGNLVGGSLQVGDQLCGVHLRWDFQPAPLPAQGVEGRFEAASGSRRGFKVSVDGPVLLGNEGLYFPLPVHYEAQRHRLDAARGEGPPPGVVVYNLPPQDGAELVAHQPVQDATRLLCIDQVQVNVPGLLEGLLEGVLSDFVEDHSLQGPILSPAECTRCQAMASPSRSGSVAR